MKADLRYEVNYKGSTVSKVKSTEKITIEGDDVTDTLETYKTTVENTYAPYKDVEHYNYNRLVRKLIRLYQNYKNHIIIQQI